MPEGWSTDEDSEVESRYRPELEKFYEDVDGIFADAKEEYQTADHIQTVFSQWKEKYPQAYEEAYISLSVSAIFAPYVRMELIKWDPVKQHSFDHFHWYKQLFSYGITDNTKDDDPDQQLIPKLVEKLVTPVLMEFLEHEWDPLSSSQQPSVLSVVRDVIEHLDPRLPVVDRLLSCVMLRLQRAVNHHLMVPTLPEAALAASSSSASSASSSSASIAESQRAFCLTRWVRAVKLLAHICQWGTSSASSSASASASASDADSDSILNEQAVQELAASHFADAIVPFLRLQLARAYATLMSHEVTASSSASSSASSTASSSSSSASASGSDADFVLMCRLLVQAVPTSWVQGRSQHSDIARLCELMTQFLSQEQTLLQASASSSAMVVRRECWFAAKNVLNEMRVVLAPQSASKSQ